MKKLSVILILFAVIFTQTELHEFFKLFVMAEHYTEHIQSNPKISFGDFLMMHYVHPHHADGDNDRDDQLPFKSSHAVIVLAPAVTLPGNFDVVKRHAFASDIPYPVYVCEGISSAHVAEIWQPPRLV